jgi:hypothetical protein
MDTQLSTPAESNFARRLLRALANGAASARRTSTRTPTLHNPAVTEPFPHSA